MPQYKLIGVVAIGRNEGERLRACLDSLRDHAPPGTPIVYVDSGSSDGSAEFATSVGADVVELDMSIPFSAARARNAGFERLAERQAGIEYVQFLDGDCLLAPDWLPQATEFLHSHADFAVVCGRRRERYRNASIYNRLIDMEWHTPIGETKACGGDALVQVNAFQQVGGYQPAVVAGEEPELCVRLRQRGWRIMRLDAEMTLHDADMNRFGQWWKRSERAGLAYALGSVLHGGPPERHWVRESRSAITWGLLVPLLILIAALATRGWGLFLFAVYPLQMARIARRRSRNGDSAGDAWLYGVFCMLAKLPQSLGVIKLHRRRWLGKQTKIIEYK